ncbi:hypothetical protein BDN71DRAFT_1509449 [Pleurotus eryngii]|uniref:Uncharacterized protein n=1 Tax=Pleurotus eryngii TaxID=5323 RepID=A0A9P5ZQJ6_PLEER|nr:hypothetical protein BDN71DRAFT_1509449 [Pleurotus eryngii]
MFYEHISINEDHLRALPDDNVPQELLQVAKLDGDIELLEQEQAGYVSEDEEESRLFSRGDEWKGSAEESPDIAEMADIIPIQAHGMVDLEASDVSDSVLMAAALRNTSEALA